MRLLILSLLLLSSTAFGQVPKAPSPEKKIVYSMLADADALKNSGQFQQAINKVNAALELDKKARALDPMGLALAKSTLGDSYLELNQPQKAIPPYEESLKSLDGPFRLHVLYNMACAQSLAKNIPKAALYYRSALELAKPHPEHLKKYITIAQTEPQLANLRAAPEFKKLMAQYSH